MAQRGFEFCPVCMDDAIGMHRCARFNAGDSHCRECHRKDALLARLIALHQD